MASRSQAREAIIAVERFTGQGVVERARSGDALAFRSLFELHAPAVRRFLRDLLRDQEAADEATQETFVRAHGRLVALQDDAKVLPWLLGIARFVFMEELRTRRHRAPELAADLAGSLLKDRAPSPEGVLMGREADRLLAEALARLPEERRAALVLRTDHGLDYEEIREVMGWTLAKVKNEIHRARLELRESLAGWLRAGE